MVVYIFWVVVRGCVYLLGGGAWLCISFGWWWVVVGLFWTVMGGGRFMLSSGFILGSGGW